MPCRGQKCGHLEPMALLQHLQPSKPLGQHAANTHAPRPDFILQRSHKNFRDHEPAVKRARRERDHPKVAKETVINLTRWRPFSAQGPHKTIITTTTIALTIYELSTPQPPGISRPSQTTQSYTTGNSNRISSTTKASETQ